MTLALPLVRFGSTHLCPSCGLVNVPAEREFCYGCSKAPTPRAAPETRLEHVRKHLRPNLHPFLDALLLPLTISGVAEHMGPEWSKRHVEYRWYIIRAELGIAGTSNSPIARMTLLRMAIGLDPCFCGR